MGLAAAETADPVSNVPKAIGSVFWRILLFYIGSIFVVGTLIPFTDPNLLRGDESHIALPRLPSSSRSCRTSAITPPA